MTNPNQRIVSFSLYGNNPKFTFGAIENAKYVANNMPGWIALFYVGNDVDKHIVSKLTKLGAIIKNQESTWHKNGMFWRFKVFRDFLPNYAIIRDSDSRITARELAAVEEWIASGKSLHIMRDHPYHNVRIPGGMWGGTKKLAGLMPIETDLVKYSSAKGQDQVFLGEFIYPLLKKDSYIHDSFFLINLKRQKFPLRRIDDEFVGESFEADNSVEASARYLVLLYSKNCLMRISLNLSYFKANQILSLRVKNYLRVFLTFLISKKY